MLREKHLTNHQLVDAMVQITQGLEYLHRNNIIHRDIKPANILVKEVEPLILKLADFDVSKFFDPDIQTSVMSTNVGTLAFKAPEFFRRDKDGKLNYDRSVDIYALGLTFLAMIQRNKLLIPRIETPQDDDELHNPIGATIANRMKYGIKELNVVQLSDIAIPSESQKVSLDVDASSAAVQFANPTLIDRLKMLISRMTCAKPEERIPVTAVLQTLSAESKVLFYTNEKVEGGTLQEIIRKHFMHCCEICTAFNFSLIYFRLREKYFPMYMFGKVRSLEFLRCPLIKTLC